MNAIIWYTLASISVGALALMLIEQVTAYAAKRVSEKGKANAQPAPSERSVGSLNDAALPAEPAEPVFSSHDRRTSMSHGTTGIVLGVLCLVLLPIVLPQQLSLLAESFGLILDRLGVPLFEIPIYDHGVVVVTDLHAYALAVVAGMLLLPSLYLLAAQASWRWSLRAPLLVTIIALPVFEVLTTAMRGLRLAHDDGRDPMQGALLSGFQALLSAALELAAGLTVIHLLLVPVIAAGVALLGRASAAVVWLGAALDSAVMDPLRKLDDKCLPMLKRSSS